MSGSHTQPTVVIGVDGSIAALYAVRHAVAAVEATDKPVKVEADITRGRATGTLLHVSRWAAMVCVGAVGSNHFQPGRIGSTAAAAVREARLRDAPLRVVDCWQPPRVDPEAATEGDRRIRAQLDRRLARWRRRYPDLQVEPIAVHGNISDYLATRAPELQLVVVGARGPGHVRDVVGPAGNTALANSDCVVLVVDHQHL